MAPTHQYTKVVKHPTEKRYHLALPPWARRLCVPVVYAAILLVLAPLHRLFSEWTGVMALFSGRELVAGLGYHGWASQFYPPLFSLLVGLVSKVADGFFAGQLISIVSTCLLLIVVYELASDVWGDERSYWPQIFLASTPLYLFEGLQADNHMLDALLFNCGLLLFIRLVRRPSTSRVLLLGAICSLAALTRYTSYVLLLLPLSFFAFHAAKRAALYAASFYLGFAVLSAPWWLYNAKYNGSALHNVNYLNVLIGIFGHDAHSLQFLWRWTGDPGINGLLDVVLQHPMAYLHHVFDMAPLTVLLLVSSVAALSPFVAPAILESPFVPQLRPLLPTLGALAGSIFAVSQAYLNAYYLMPWALGLVVVCVGFLLRYLERLERKFPEIQRYHATQIALGVLIAVNLFLCVRTLRAYQREPETYSALVDARPITLALQKHDHDLQSKVIMAVDPARAYYARAKYLATPFDYSGDAEGLVTYEGVSERLRHYAPKYPSNMDEGSLRADYLIYVRPNLDRPWELHDPARFMFLMDPNSDRLPRNFKLVYKSPDAVVYEVVRNQSSVQRNKKYGG
jgi:hypothetical protein